MSSAVIDQYPGILPTRGVSVATQRAVPSDLLCCAIAWRGAQLPKVQRVLGHSWLSTTGIYLTPSEDDLRAAIKRTAL